MAEAEHMIVMCYDISRSTTRRRVAAFLEERLVRVQKSTFEGRMTPSNARRLFAAATAKLDEGDSLRLYMLDKDSLSKSQTHGGPPLPEDSNFYLF